MSAHGISDISEVLAPLGRTTMALSYMTFNNANTDADCGAMEKAQSILDEVMTTLRELVPEDRRATAVARVQRVAGDEFNPVTWSWIVKPTSAMERDMLLLSIDEFCESMTGLMQSKKRSASEMVDTGGPSDRVKTAAQLLFEASGSGAVADQLEKLHLGPAELRNFADVRENAEGVLKGGVSGIVTNTATGMHTHTALMQLFDPESKPETVITVVDGQLVTSKKKLTLAHW